MAGADFEILDGAGEVWIVWQDMHPPDGGYPKFLAAYSGKEAERSAKALVDLVKSAGAYGQVEAAAVPLWPLLRANVTSPAAALAGAGA